MAPTHPRIAIIGGGPSGLVVLLTLHKRGIPATVYERDTDPFSRFHLGGTLDLRWEHGQRALRENGLAEVFAANSRPEGDEYVVTDAAANVLLKTPENYQFKPEEIRPEIDRSTLRRILLDAVPPESVKWGHAVAAVRPLGGGQHEITFTNGTTAVCDILVGADGANSRVRPLVSDAPVSYSGVTGAEISLAPDVAAQPDMADVRALIGKGTLFAPQDGRILIPQINSDGRVRTYAFFLGPEDWALPNDPDAARAALRELYKGWAPILLKLIDYCDSEAIYHRPLYMLPVGHKWAHVDGVTLVGDAAYLMTPFAGMGANVAMLTGLECGLALAEAINKGASTAEREEIMAKHEERMHVEGALWSKVTFENKEAIVSPDAPASAMKKFSSIARADGELPSLQQKSN